MADFTVKNKGRIPNVKSFSNAMIDHTVLKPTTTESDVLKVIDEAVEHGFAAVCIPPNYVKMARTALDKRRDADGDTGVKVATVIGFPFGYSNTGAKLAEIEIAIADGADELDVVANISDIKAARWDLLQAEINSIMRASKRDPNAPAWKVPPYNPNPNPDPSPNHKPQTLACSTSLIGLYRSSARIAS